MSCLSFPTTKTSPSSNPRIVRPTRPFSRGDGFWRRKEETMAIEDWCHWDLDEDYFGNDPEESLPFECPCKWCGKQITMTPTNKGWRPMYRGKLHVCEERKAEQARKLLDAMPDLSLPSCQFCGGNMEWRRFNKDPEEWSWFPEFRLVCSGCGAMGPSVKHGEDNYDKLLKTV